MIVLGIDPGYAITGFGIVELKAGRLRIIDYGVVSTHSSMAFPSRLLSIAEALDELIATHKPDAVAVEELFFSRNTTTAIGTAQARGVAVLAGAKAGLPVYEYTPMQVKVAVTGFGCSDKAQIQQMVRVLLNLREIPKPDDAADALAVAICHAHSGPRPEAAAIGGYQKCTPT